MAAAGVAAVKGADYIWFGLVWFGLSAGFSPRHIYIYHIYQTTGNKMLILLILATIIAR